MRITAIDTFKCWASWCNWLFVRVTTDDGQYGWGEGSLHGAIQSVETAVHELAPVLVGKDPAGLERHWHAMYHAWRWRGGPTLSTALGALDIALWDLEGKRLGVPVSRLLGGPIRTRLRVYASHWLRDARTPDEAWKGARDAAERGFSGFKWNPFQYADLRQNEARALLHATELMAAARAGAGDDLEIFVECGELLSPRTLVEAAKRFAPYRPAWFEEPVPFENPKVLGELQCAIAVPIATGERLLSRWEYRELLEHAGCRVVQPDVMHAGGLTEVRKIASMADTYYVSVAPHNPGGPICTAASMHLSAAIPNFLILEEMEGERSLRDEISMIPIVCEQGHFVLPDRPGLGVDLDVEALQKRAFRPQPVSGRDDALYR